MKQIRLGRTEIITPQNAFGALPIQRCTFEESRRLLLRAYEGGMTFFDTARAYSDSEEKIGKTFKGMRDKVIIASKTQAKNTADFWRDLDTSLEMLQTDYIDLYQLHCVQRCYRPGDGSGMYEALVEAKRQGKIRHIGITAHLIGVAEKIAESGLYETLQYPLSYLASDREVEIVKTCAVQDTGFIAMKGLAGGLLTNSIACMAYMTQFDNVVPIWGVQTMEELEEWLDYMEGTPRPTDEIREFWAREREELAGDFCRGCGYCLPCTAEIPIFACARMSLMLRRAPSQAWLTDMWQEAMERIEDCTDCGKCQTRCPYNLDVPNLLRRNLEDYRKVLAGEVEVD